MAATAETMTIELTTQKKRGCKKGQRHSGMFVKGDSRLAKGKRLRTTDVLRQAQELSAKYLPDAIKYMGQVLKDENESTKHRMEAGKFLVERSAGRAVELKIEKHETGDGSFTTLSENATSPQSLSDSQLTQLLHDAMTFKQHLEQESLNTPEDIEDAEIISVTPEQGGTPD